MDASTSLFRPAAQDPSGRSPFATFSGRIDFLPLASLSTQPVASPFGQAAFWGVFSSSFGSCVLGWSGRAIFHLSFTESIDDPQPPSRPVKHPFKTLQRADTPASEIGRQIFGETDATSDLRVLAIGTRFQIQVWRALLEIPTGETVSYGNIAKSIGMPSAVRAVGSACGANPIACIIPCHRVVGASGALTGYRWGVPLKKRLLAAEQALRPKAATEAKASQSPARPDIFSQPQLKIESLDTSSHEPTTLSCVGRNVSSSTHLTCA